MSKLQVLKNKGKEHKIKTKNFEIKKLCCAEMRVACFRSKNREMASV